MSREDEVRTTAHNVLHAAFGSNQCAIKIAAFGLSHPIVRRLTPTSKRSTIPAAADGIGRVDPSEAKRRDTNPVSVELLNEIRDGKMKGSKH